MIQTAESIARHHLYCRCIDGTQTPDDVDTLIKIFESGQVELEMWRAAFLVFYPYPGPPHAAIWRDVESLNASVRWSHLIQQDAHIEIANMLRPKGWTLARVTEQDNKSFWVSMQRGFLTSYDKVVIAQAPTEGHARMAANLKTLRVL